MMSMKRIGGLLLRHHALLPCRTAAVSSRITYHGIASSVTRARTMASLSAQSESSPYPPPSLPTSPNTSHLEPKYTYASANGQAKTQSKSIIDTSEQYILPVYARPPFVLSHGKGSYVWDMEGNKYLDFTAGIAVNALGQADEGVAKVVAEQAGKLLHTSNVYYNEWSSKLAELLVTLTQREGGLGYAAGSTEPPAAGAKVFFANSGTEANEGALKIARKVGKDRAAASGAPPNSKTRLVSFENSFHGRSMGALSMTANAKYQKPFEPLIPGVDVGKVNCAVEDLDALVTDETCGVIVECIQGEGGINVAQLDWLRALRKRCDQVGAVLIFDEIQCGLYRSGTLWAHSALPIDCHPDIITMAKPLANGFPIGSVLMRDSIAATMTAGTHGTTFGGSPIACAVGYHVLSRLSERAFVSHVAEVSAYLTARLELLPKWFPGIVQEQMRGRGLIRGIGFKNAEHPGKLVELARERGVFFLTAGKDAVRLVPSLTIGKKEVDEAMDVLESCLALL